jgi:hypothetical protein
MASRMTTTLTPKRRASSVLDGRLSPTANSPSRMRLRMASEACTASERWSSESMAWAIGYGASTM